MESELHDLLRRVEARSAELPAGSAARRDLLAHLRSLARWRAEPRDYPEAGPVDFPAAVRQPNPRLRLERNCIRRMRDPGTQAILSVWPSTSALLPRSL